MQASTESESGLGAASQLLGGAGRIVVIAHVNPDADAVGAVLGLSGGLIALGKTVYPVLSDEVPEYARFLAGSARIAPAFPDEPLDLIVCADSADMARIGDVYDRDPERFSRTTVLNVDHHRTNPLYGTVNYVDGAASSTSELCYRLLCELGAPIDADTATALLFGIFGDTGAFQNAATTPGALESAAALVRQGADNQRIAYQLFERKRFVAARLWGRILSAIELDAVRHIVFGFMSQQELQTEGATPDETEGVAEYLRGIEEADVVMLLKETADGEIRVSMRSRPSVDVSAIASALNGGGHRQAAGCTLPGPFESARRALVETYDRLNPR